MASLKEFLGSTGLGALWARITEELNKKATSADLANVATSGSYNDLEDKPFIPSAVSDLTDDSGHYTKPANGIPASDLEETYLTSFTETDPTVPSWAKEAQKPSYTAAEVGAMGTDHPANDITNVKIQNWDKHAGLVEVSGEGSHDEWYWSLTLPRDGMYEFSNAPGSRGYLKYINIPVEYNKPLISLRVPTKSGQLALITDTPAWARAAQKPTYTAQEVGALSADTVIPTVPTNVSAFTNDAGYLTEHQDISGKADKSEIPTSVSELTNDAGYITGYTETDPTVPAWAKASTKPSYTAAEVGAPTVAEMNSAISTAIGNINSFDMAVVQELPTQNISTHTIYLVPKTGETNDVYDEYIYINNAWEMIGNTQVDLSNYATKSEIPNVPVQDVQINGTSILSNGTANIPIATSSGEYGAVAINTNYGIASYNNTGTLMVMPASSEQIKTATNGFRPIVSPHQHESVFYGLAKAAGDTTQSQSNNAVGTYTTEAKAAIRSMLGAAASADLTVQDVQINGTSILSNGIANIPLADDTHIGAVKIHSDYGWGTTKDGYLRANGASTYQMRQGTDFYRPIVSANQHISVFFALAKIAGHDEKDSPETIGTYTGAAKQAIQNMLGITSLISTEESSTATAAHALNSTFMMDGKLYKATAAIAIGEAVIEGQNCEVVKADEVFVKKTDYASSEVAGLIKTSPTYGLSVNSSTGLMSIIPATVGHIKTGTAPFEPITVNFQHYSIFYGLSKAAGVDLKDETVTFGTYPETSKTAIRSLIGAAAVSDIPSVPVQDIQVNSASIVSNGIANFAIASPSTLGLVKVSETGTFGLSKVQDFDANNQLYYTGEIAIQPASNGQIKGSSGQYNPITPTTQHRAVFFGLAKAAGDSTQSASSNAIGTYTDGAKSAIQTMLGITDALASKLNVAEAGLRVVRLI